MRFFRIALIVIASLTTFVCDGHRVLADHTVQLLKPRDWTPELRQAVENYFLVDPGGRSRLAEINNDRRRERQIILPDLKVIDTLIAAFADVDDDGIPELFIGFSPYFGFCGTGGCQVEVYKITNGGWKSLGGFLDSSLEFTVTDRKIGAYHVIISSAVSKGEEFQYTVRCVEQGYSD